MSRKRNCFSDKEDDFLISFIAERNFGPGRTGNQIFQTLADNAQGSWPLAGQHTWQSWRNRYMKDREYFDYKIAKYQKSHGIRPTQKAKVDKATVAKNEVARRERLLESMKRITATKTEEEEEEEGVVDHRQDTESAVKREDESGKGKRKKSSDDGIHRRKRHKIAVEVTAISSEEVRRETDGPGGIAKVSEEGGQENKPRTAVVQEISKQLVGLDVHMVEHSAKEEPKVVELDVSGIDKIPIPTTNEAQRNFHVDEPPVQPPATQHDHKPCDAADAFFQSVPPTPKHLQSPLARRRPRGLPHLFDGPFSHSLTGANSRMGTHHAEEEEGSGEDSGQECGRESREGDMNGEWPPIRLRSQVVGHKSKEKGKAMEVPLKIDRQVQTTNTRNQKIERPTRVTLPALRTPPLASVYSRGSLSPRTPISNTDSKSISTNGLPEINLAADARSRGRSLPGLQMALPEHFRGSSRTSRTSLTPPILINDHNLIYGEGLKAIIRKMSENHGFQENVTWRLWNHLGHVEVVDKTLKKMREAADAAAMETMNETESELLAAGVERRDHLERWSEPGRGAAVSASNLSGYSPNLHFTAAPVVNYDSVYTPPEASRAGQFARLVKEGRLREALKREGRKARHGGVSPGKTRKVGSLPVPGLISVHHQSPKSRGIAVTKDDSRSERRAWGPKEDDLLLAAGRGDELALQDLEATMGKFAVRQRTAHMFTLL